MSVPKTSLLKTFENILYFIRERSKLRKFRRLISQGVVKCEPRFRLITSLDEDRPIGTVEYAHVCRYNFAAKHLQGRVLNVACGSGYGNRILADAGCLPVGVDLYQEPLDIAATHFPYGEYHRGDAQHLQGFGDASFDGVVSFETLEHVSDPFLTCQTFKRVLKAGGILIGSIPIMIFHNPGTNFTYQHAQHFVKINFPNSQIYLQTNSSLAEFSDHEWDRIRNIGDKYFLWIWKNL